MTTFTIVRAEAGEKLGAIRELFREYAGSLSFSLCFQNFDEELAALPGDYASPSGALFLALFGHEAVGCVALRRLGSGTGEMKRLYVRPQYRGFGLGRLLCKTLIAEARELGYDRLRLDTVESQMREAVALYRKAGFQDIAPYRPNPLDGVLYMELKL